MGQVLIFYDSPEPPEKLADLLKSDDHRVELAGSGKKVLSAIRSTDIDLLIAYLPAQNFATIDEILDELSHQCPEVPVLILVPAPTIPKLILTLERGASDLMNLPYDPRVLLAKVRALIRKGKRKEGSTLRSGLITLYPDKFRVVIGDSDVRPTAAQFKLITLFLRNPGKIFSRSELMEAISLEPDDKSRSIDTQIVILRKLLGTDGKRIVTKRGVGYFFRSE